MDFESILDLAKTKINPLKCTKNEGFYILESDFQIKKEAEIPDFLKSEENTNSVLKDFDERFDNIESRMDRAVAFLDLYEEEFIGLKEGKVRYGEFGDPETELSEGGEINLILVAENPISSSHLALYLYPREGMPQVIGCEMMEEALSIFGMIPERENLYIGYNSACAGAEINQLHFECLDLTEVQSFEFFHLKSLPIEHLEYKNVLSTSLTSQDECNLFEVGVDISMHQGIPSVIKVSPTKIDMDPIHLTKSVSFVVNLFVSHFLADGIPHNLIFTKKGYDCYIFPRGDRDNRFGWPEVAGIPRLQKLSDEFNHPTLHIWENRTLQSDKFNFILGEVIGSIKSKFE